MSSIDPEPDAELPEEMSNALRDAGLEVLLLRYAAALQWFNRTRAVLERAHAGGQINEAAQEAMNEALEEFEHVEAEVYAAFDDLADKRES
jgi:hypothetical protein